MMRYSLQTASKVIGLHAMTIYKRAKKLGIETRAGLTAEEIRRVSQFEDVKRQRRGSESALRAELEGMK